MRDQDQEAFMNILDCIACTDGGPRLVKFKQFIEMYSEQAGQGDEGSQGLMDIMIKFSRLIDAAQR